MSYHDVQICCALANFHSHQISPDLSRSLIIPAAPLYHMEFLDAIARLLHHWSLYSTNQFCFNSARKANKESICVQHELCIHDPENTVLIQSIQQSQVTGPSVLTKSHRCYLKNTKKLQNQWFFAY